jgi:uncharacterized protein (DUF2252 family)
MQTRSSRIVVSIIGENVKIANCCTFIGAIVPKSKHTAPQISSANSDLPTVAERKAIGHARRARCPRSALAQLEPPSPRRSLLTILRKDSAGRLPNLIPIRYGRMLPSPFAFLRGAVAVMMEDIGRLPRTDIDTQLCGDCHIRNFGGFASPEQALLFGINDFDQTLPGPFEWDVKRLAASVVVAARDQGISDKNCVEAATAAARTYRERMAEFARMHAMDTWYFRIEAQALVDMANNMKTRRKRQALIEKAARHSSEQTFRKLANAVDGAPQIRDQPPLIYHLKDVQHFENEVRAFLGHYLKTLPEERRALLNWFTLFDVAAKVTGVGSVGTRCAIALLMTGADDPLFLQLKEARPSVLEPFAGKARQKNQGLRVVIGQHLMQAASDPFLGWFREPDLKTDFYVRQYNDVTFSLDSDAFSAQDFVDYAQICSWELARAHARAGDAAMISGYLGKGDAFDKAIAKFAVAYADRTESDHRLFVNAVKSGKIRATVEE